MRVALSTLKLGLLLHTWPMGSGAETRSMTVIGMLTAIIVMRKSRPFV
jgi:hypothetical protein